mgnify:CR=1 FL=1
MNEKLELPQFPWKHILRYVNGKICFDADCNNTMDEIYQMIDDFIEEMRDATPEELGYINKKVEEISEPTGVNFYDVLTK